MSQEDGHRTPEQFRLRFDAASAKMEELGIERKLQAVAPLLGMTIHTVNSFETSGNFGYYPLVILGTELQEGEPRDVLRVYPEPDHLDLTAIVAFHESVIDRRLGNVRGGYTIGRETVRGTRGINTAILRGIRSIAGIDDGKMEKRITRALEDSITTPGRFPLLRR